MKIGICTDLHLGLRQYGLKEREQDFYKQYQMAIDVFIKNNVDIVIMGGDIFDQPRPSPTAMNAFTSGLHELASHDIDVVNIIGNHAMIQASDFITADEFIFNNIDTDDNAVFQLLDYKDESIDCLERRGVTIYGLPYHFNFDLDNFIAKVDVLNQAASSNKGVSILVLHQAFKEYCGFTGENLSIHDIDVSNFDLVVCGHIHERKLTDLDDGTVFLQPGSIERSTIAEARDEENNGKGVYIIDTNKMDLMSIADAFIRIPCYRPFLIANMYMDSREEIVDIENEIRKDIQQRSLDNVAPVLFLTVHDTSSSLDRLMDLTSDLKSICLTTRLNYMDESQTQEEIYLKSTDMLDARNVLKLALNPMDDNQAMLALDIYDAIKSNQDISDLLDDYFKKNYSEGEEQCFEVDEDREFLDEMKRWATQ